MARRRSVNYRGRREGAGRETACFHARLPFRGSGGRLARTHRSGLVRVVARLSGAPRMSAFLLSFACALVPILQDARGSASEGDRAYAYVAGLAEKGLDDMVVKEAQAFLDAYPHHAKRT